MKCKIIATGIFRYLQVVFALSPLFFLTMAVISWWKGYHIQSINEVFLAFIVVKMMEVAYE
jgi:hypothetical protein